MQEKQKVTHVYLVSNRSLALVTGLGFPKPNERGQAAWRGILVYL
jgi:hypothetical protein